MSSSRFRPPPRLPYETKSHQTDNKTRSPRYNDHLFKILLLLVVVVGMMNLAIFSSIIDPTQRHLPSVHLPDVAKDQSHIDTDSQDIHHVDEHNTDSIPIRKAAEHIDGGDNDSKDRIIALLEKAGVEVTPDIIASLPSWSSVVAQYGSEPVIVGLETCEKFRATVPNADVFVGPAGMFNTGTNLVSELMQANCYLPDKVKKYGKELYGMRWQVPWGKHSPATWRLKHSAPTKWALSVDKSTILPIVTIKDPYHWMGSMCRKHYEAFWPHTEKNCPNLIRELDNSLTEVEVRYRKENITKHETLVGLWNDYYKLYVDDSFPHLIIRYEDLLFHPKYVISKACECAGGLMKNDDLVLIEGNAKPDKGSSNMLSAIKRYGNVEKRAEGFSVRDKKYAESALSKDLVELFGYKIESKLRP